MLFGVLIIGLCIFTLYLLNKVSDLVEQDSIKNDVILDMINELQTLGSPNVKIMNNDKTN